MQIGACFDPLKAGRGSHALRRQHIAETAHTQSVALGNHAQQVFRAVEHDPAFAHPIALAEQRLGLLPDLEFDLFRRIVHAGAALDEFTGTTRFYKGTHRVATERAEESGAQDPMVPLGSCVLNDYRCAHRGLGNRSQVVRPILTLIYNRPWFRDFKNYGQQPPLRLSEGAYERMPSDLQPLVAWWKNERRVDQLDHSQLIQPREVPAMAGAQH